MSRDAAFLERIKARITLSDVIGTSVRLKKAGREFMGLCPFHNEKTPSFTVNDGKGFYHCFGCGAHGSVIDFLMHKKGLSFGEALEAAAETAGLGAEFQAQRKSREKALPPAFQSYYDIMHAAQVFFQNQLNQPHALGARQYLEKRGLSIAVQQKFGIGLAPPPINALQQHLSEQNFSQHNMEACGLLSKTDHGGYRDKFRGRITFPIFDRRGRVIAFGGRAQGDQKPKYLNSPETPLFQKRENLYNIQNLTHAKPGAMPLLVVEGYMDAIQLDTYGFDRTVAPLGTAMTEAQFELCWRYDTTVHLLFDGDTAGQQAALKTVLRVLPMVGGKKRIHIVRLPDGQDPDSFVRAEGKEGMHALIQKGQPLIEFLWDSLYVVENPQTPEEKAHHWQTLKKTIQDIADGDVRQNYLSLLKQRYDADRYPKNTFSLPRPRARRADVGRFKQQQYAILIYLGIEYPAIIQAHIELFSDIIFPDALAPIHEALLRFLSENKNVEKASLHAYIHACQLGDAIPVFNDAELHLLMPSLLDKECDEGVLAQKVQRHIESLIQSQAGQEKKGMKDFLKSNMTADGWEKYKKQKELLHPDKLDDA